MKHKVHISVSAEVEADSLAQVHEKLYSPVYNQLTDNNIKVTGINIDYAAAPPEPSTVVENTEAINEA